MVPLTMPSTRLHLVAGQRLAQRAEQRDRAGDRGLEVEVDAGLGGRGVQRRAVLGEQRLVGGDDRLARARSAASMQRAGRLDPADHLDDDVDVVARDQRGGVGGEQLGGSTPSRPLGRAGARAMPTSSSGAPMRAARSSALLVEQPRHLGADVAAAQQRHA